ncbi:MAG: hypothetical protein NG784_13540 [Candidatus Jettenia sp.]|nr:hypothetical protein [Candidatus Jettenia sp.]
MRIYKERGQASPGFAHELLLDKATTTFLVSNADAAVTCTTVGIVYCQILFKRQRCTCKNLRRLIAACKLAWHDFIHVHHLLSHNSNLLATVTV